MVSRYVPDMGDLIGLILTRQKVASKLDIVQLLSESFHVQQQNRYVSVCSLYNQSKGYPFEVVLSGQERDGVA